MASDVRAHHAVVKAIALGALPPAKELPCADCPGQARLYHHESYEPSRWLDVVALCGSCHRARHRGRPALPRDPHADVPWTIRLTDAMHAELKAVAKRENRSINGTVVEAIERYLRARRGRQPKDAQDAR